MAARNDYERYLETRWTGIEVPASVVADAVEEVFGVAVAGAERWIRSYTNEVHAITTRDGRELIVRISRGDQSRFAAESWARMQCGERGVPVAEMFGIATRDLAGETLSLSVEQRLPGETLDILMSTGTIARDVTESLVARAGELLAVVHAIPTVGWGPIDGLGRGGQVEASWGLRYFKDQLPVMRSTARRLRLAFRHVERAVELLDGAAQPNALPCLIHGDLGPKHLLVDGDEVVAILDFENAQGGEPFDDIGFWLYAYPDDAGPLRRGYERRTQVQDFEQRLALARVKVGLAYLAIYGGQPTDATPPGFMAKVARTLRSDVDGAAGW